MSPSRRDFATLIVSFAFLWKFSSLCCASARPFVVTNRLAKSIAIFSRGVFAGMSSKNSYASPVK